MTGELLQLITFLLPKSPLDFLFFFILLGWLVYSLFAAKQVLGRFPKIIKNSTLFKQIDTKNAHDLMLAARVPRWDNVVDNAAGFALVLGLLGTFLGIGLAINHAGQVLGQLSQAGSEAVDITKTITSLKPMLTEIGLKFKSSAWGIITHIILRVVIPRFGIDRKRAEAILGELRDDANREKEEAQAIVQQEQVVRNRHLQEIMRSNELLKALLAAAKRNEEQSSIQNASTIAAVASFRESFGEVVTRLHQETVLEVQKLGVDLNALLECNRNTEESLRVIKTFGKQVDKLGGSVTNFAEKITEFKEDTRSVLNNMDESLQSSITQIDGTVKAMSERIDTVLKSFSENMTSTIENLRTNMNSSTEQLNGTVVEMKESVTDTIAQFNDKVTVTLNAAGDKISNSSSNIEVQVNKLSDNLDSALNKVHKSLETTNAVMIEMQSHSQDMASVFKRHEKSNELVMDKITEMTSNSARYSTSLNDMSDSLAATFGTDGEIANKLDRLVQEHQSNMRQLQQIASAIEAVRSSMSVINQGVVNKLDALLDASHGIRSASLNAHESLLKIHESIERSATA